MSLINNSVPLFKPALNVCSPWYPEPPDRCTNRTVDGVIITANAVTTINGSETVERLNTSVLLEPVRIAFQHRTSMGINPTCAFLNEQRLQVMEEAWLTERCSVVVEESSEVQTVCECFHLTSFALLLSPTASMVRRPPLWCGGCGGCMEGVANSVIACCLFVC